MVQLARTVGLLVVQPAAGVQLLRSARICTVPPFGMPAVDIFVPGVYAFQVEPLVLNWYVSEQPTPALPALKVADTEVPSHTAATFGVLAFKVGLTGLALIITVAVDVAI